MNIQQILDVYKERYPALRGVCIKYIDKCVSMSDHVRWNYSGILYLTVR